MSNNNNSISELEQLVDEKKPEPKPSRAPLDASKVGYSAAIVIIDLITGWTIWQLSYWYYGVVWFLAGAISFYLHQQNWEHPGVNEKQEKNAMIGMIVSVASMFLMAIGAGLALIFGVTSNIAEAVIVACVILAFFWHALQLALFYFSDDDWEITRQINRAKATANKKVQIARAAGEVVSALKAFQNERDNQHQKHGDGRAVDAAMAKIGGQKQVVQYSADVSNSAKNPVENERKEPNPTNGQEKRN